MYSRVRRIGPQAGDLPNQISSDMGSMVIDTVNDRVSLKREGWLHPHRVDDAAGDATAGLSARLAHLIVW